MCDSMASSSQNIYPQYVSQYVQIVQLLHKTHTKNKLDNEMGYGDMHQEAFRQRKLRQAQFIYE